jgi:hypothetical protein
MISRTNASPKTRDFARRLIAYEAADRNPSGENAPVAVLVSEKLRRPLSTLVGVTGFRSLLARALVLAKSEDHNLGAVRVKPDGSLDGFSELHNDEAAEAGVMLIANLLGLLSAFIGESLVLALLRDAWPDLPFDDTNSGGTKLR